MIPYFSFATLSLGPITLHVWGMFVAGGFVLAGVMAAWMAKQRGDNPSIIWDLVVWTMIAGMIGGRIGHVVFYDPLHYVQRPLEIFAVWEGGMSLYGGLLAGIAVGVWYLRRRNVDVWRYSDAVAFGLPFGKWIGRLGCFFIHDHPGTATDFVLGVQYPDGVTRHDLGLYLSINALLLAAVMLWLSRKVRPVGTYIVVFAMWYGATRFSLDFLRIIDVRYFGLTPGQYFSILLSVCGIAGAVWIRKRSK